MSLSSGNKLGPYEILAPLGAGGMGEVYRARDTRLERTVAIKILASHLSSSPELKQRFEREAKTVSSLNHAHICQLFDVGSQDGTDYLVMEFLEGETLAERLRKGPVPLNELLKIGIEVAEALEVAHRAGIIHRDLKPGNIMLTKSGAKLMDFGLAKPAALGAAASGSAPLLSAARTASGPSPMSPLTTAGSIVGTIQYMSPEQIEGKEADIRSDIFAFGAVLYEMATGKRAFEGKSQISVASAILEKDPDPISTTKPMTPPQFEHIVRRALDKIPDDRWQTASDIRGELKWIAEGGAQSQASERQIQKRSPRWLPLFVAVFLALTAIGAFLFWRSQPSGPSGVIQAYLPSPEGATFILTNDDESGPAVISPDGKNIAFVATDGKSSPQIWVRSLSESAASPLPGTANSTYPFWSPDSKWLGFFADGEMKKESANGGPVISLCGVVRPRGGSWGTNGLILYAPGIESGIFSVPAGGGTPKEITKPTAGVHTTNRWPVWLPGDQRFLFLASNHSSPDASDRNGIYVGSLDGKENRMLMPADSNVALAPGYLLSIQNGALMVQAFDSKSAEIKGDPIPIAQHPQRNSGTWRGAFDVSNNGILIYQAGISNATTQLLWYTPDNKPAAQLGDPGLYSQLRLSPDGKKVVVSLGDPSLELWIYDVARGVRTRLTFGNISAEAATWSPDGSQVAFTGLDSGKYGIYVKNASGSGEQKLLLPSTGKGTWDFVNDWSQDGQYLAYTEIAASSAHPSIWVLPMAGDRKPRKFSTDNSAWMDEARFSPDVKWMAYVSDESGKAEVYVTTFPVANGKWQISANGGGQPRWRRDGRAIIYRGAEGALMEAPLTVIGNTIEVGAVRTYVKAVPVARNFGSTWDLAPDGRVIAEIRPNEDTSTITMVLNWQSEIKK